MVPATSVVMRAGAGIYLLLRDADSGQWVFPGGAIEPDDPNILVAAMREIQEETGWNVLSSSLKLKDVLTGPDLVKVYANQDVTQAFIAVFSCEADYAFDVALSDEHSEFVWTPRPLDILKEHIAHKIYGASGR